MFATVNSLLEQYKNIFVLIRYIFFYLNCSNGLRLYRYQIYLILATYIFALVAATAYIAKQLVTAEKGNLQDMKQFPMHSL